MGNFIYPPSGVKFPGYTAAAFTANWGNLGAPFAPVSFYKDGTGRVFLRGIATHLIAGLLPPQTVFNLPAGFRPAFDTDLICMGGDLSLGTIVFVTLKVTALGAVMGTSVNGGAGDAFDFISFDGVSFQTN